MLLSEAEAARLLGWRNVSRLRALYPGRWSGVNPITGRVEPLPEGVAVMVWVSLVGRRCGNFMVEFSV